MSYSPFQRCRARNAGAEVAGAVRRPVARAAHQGVVRRHEDPWWQAVLRGSAVKALHLAASVGHTEATKALVWLGVDVHAQRERGATALLKKVIRRW